MSTHHHAHGPDGDHHHHHHAHAHESGHGAGHGHHHAPASFGKAFAIGIALNAGFVLVEGTFGVVSHSVSLLADAGHNLGDVLSLFVAFAAARLGRRGATARFTYGFRGSSILAALFNAVLLLVIVGGLTWEALTRLAAPEPTGGLTVMAVAAAGIAVNGITAWLFASGRDTDINIRGAYLHMAADAAVSIGVVLAGLIIVVTGWLWVDPLASLLVNVVIVIGTWSLLRDSLSMSLDAVPPGIDAAGVRAFLLGRPGVSRLHDLHIWAMSTTETAITVHLTMPSGHPGDHFLRGLADELRDRFGIVHATVQIETSLEGACVLDTSDQICGAVTASGHA